MNKRQRGFTLVELLVTVTVVGILVGLAGPNFTRMMLNNRSVAFGEEVIAQVNSARHEAINRGANVSICASNTGTSCSGTWTDGYIIFVDTATSTTASTPIVGTIIRQSEKINSSAVFTVTNGGSAVNFIRFTSLGLLGRVANSANPIIIDTQMTNCKGNYRREVTVSISGTISVATQACQ